MGIATIYAGPDFFTDPSDTVSGIQMSGFTTVVGSSLDVDWQGDLQWAGNTLVSNGQWVGDPALLQNWPQLKGPGCSVQTFMLGLGTPQVDDFSYIAPLLASYPNALATNIVALKQLLPALDGFDLSDAFMKSDSGMIDFCNLAVANGLQISFNPASATTASSTLQYWQNVWSQWQSGNPGIAATVNLGDFAGIDPALYAQWWNKLPGANWVCCIPYINEQLPQPAGRCPGSYSGMLATMNQQKPIAGGAMYLYDDFVNSPPPYPHCQCGEGSPCYLPDYAAAIAAAP